MRELYKIRLVVQTHTALHIGTQQGKVIDNPLRRDSHGRVLLPGSSIAGALRAHLTRILPARGIVCAVLDEMPPAETACACALCHLMGDIFPSHQVIESNNPDERERLNGRASRLIFSDTVIDLASTKTMDGVGIDRTVGAASRQGRVKFETELVLPDTVFSIDLELEDPNDTDLTLLALALDEWKEGRIYVGGKSRRGLGRLALSEVSAQVYRLHEDPAHLRAILDNTPSPERVNIMDWYPREDTYHLVSHAGTVHSWARIDYILDATGFFITNDVDRAQRAGFNHFAAPYLPGSSIRGVLRSHAEQIARTITTLTYDEEDFLVHCPAANPTATSETLHTLQPTLVRLTRAVQENPTAFSRKEQKNPPYEWFDLAEQLFGSTAYGSRLFVEDARIIGTPVYKPMDFLAVDRFTGGSADQLKFDAVALWQPRFEGRIYLETPKQWELGWLSYVLRDIEYQRLCFGFGAAKGFGQVNLATLQWTIGWTTHDSFPATELPSEYTNGFFRQFSFEGWHPSYHDEWKQAWSKTIAAYKVEPRLAHNPRSDPYWAVSDLYLKEVTFDDLSE